jgi:hypothetical protein
MIGAMISELKEGGLLVLECPKWMLHNQAPVVVAALFSNVLTAGMIVPTARKKGSNPGFVLVTAIRGPAGVERLPDSEALLRVLCLGDGREPTELGQACLAALTMTSQRHQLPDALTGTAHSRFSSITHRIAVLCAGALVLHGFSPFAPILAAVAAKQNEYTSGACVRLLGSFLRAAGTSEAAIVARVKTREEEFHRANLLPESKSTPAAAAAALGPSTASVYGLKSVDPNEGLEKGRDVVYALCTVVGGSVAKVGIGPKSRPMEQCNEHNKEHPAKPIPPVCLALFPPGARREEERR